MRRPVTLLERDDGSAAAVTWHQDVVKNHPVGVREPSGRGSGPDRRGRLALEIVPVGCGEGDGARAMADLAFVLVMLGGFLACALTLRLLQGR